MWWNLGVWVLVQGCYHEQSPHVYTIEHVCSYGHMLTHILFLIYHRLPYMIKTHYWKTVVQRPKSKCVLFWAQEHSVPEKDSCKFANTHPAYRHNWHGVTLAIVFFWPPEIQDEKWNIPLWAVVWSEMSGAICKIINYWSLTWLIFIILRPHPNDSCFITNLVYANASSCSISPLLLFWTHANDHKWICNQMVSIDDQCTI